MLQTAPKINSMKNLMLLSLGLGIFVVSCGTKESSMQNTNPDSASVNVDTTRSVSPARVDTLKVDSAAVPPATK